MYVLYTYLPADEGTHAYSIIYLMACGTFKTAFKQFGLSATTPCFASCEIFITV